MFKSRISSLHLLQAATVTTTFTHHQLIVLIAQVQVVNLVAQVVDEVVDLGDARAIALNLLDVVNLLHQLRHPAVDARDDLVLAVVDLLPWQQQIRT